MKIDKLIEAAYNYYRLGKSIISDSEYDKLFEEVRQWEIDNNVEDKLTDRVCLGYFEGDSTVKVKHKFPMLSIKKDNSRAITEETVITPKLDGVALELEYINGVLYRKLTRGDGEYGSDVTKTIIHSVPGVVMNSGSFIIRGEIMCQVFKDYGKVHRNVVAGALGKTNITEDRYLNFISYWTSLELDTYEQELQWLKTVGFSVVPYIVSARPLNITPDLIKTNYPTDGYVLRVNNNKDKWEQTAHHYKNQWAFKFAAETKVTTIEDVDWKQSKNGYFTPVALLAPVEIDGTTVSRVTLNNLDYIKERDICIGDTILIHKAKEIIPEIKEIITRPIDRKPIVLLTCPNCNNDLEMKGIRLTCTNIECSVNLFTEHFCKTIGIKGLAIKSIEKLNLSRPLDLYDETYKSLTNALGKNGEKIYAQIQDSKDVDIITLLCALNIPAIKKTKLTKIFTKFPELEILGIYDKLVQVEGMGDKTSKIVVDWYNNRFLPLKLELESIGFDLIVKKPQVTAKLIAVTGKLPMSRKEFTRMMVPKLINVQPITKNTLLLVCGDKPGNANLTKAEKYGISIVSYSQFIKDLKTE